MVVPIQILVVLGTTLLVLIQASPVHRNNNQDTLNPYAAAVLPASEFSEWHNESRQRRMRMVVGRNESVFTLLPPPQSDAVSNRDKERRLKAIELFILEALGRSNKVPTLPPPFVNGVEESDLPLVQDLTTSNPPNHHHRSNNSFPGRLDSFKASCDLPSKVDAEAWNQPADFFRIFFNLSTLADVNLPNVNMSQGSTNPQAAEMIATTRIPGRSPTHQMTSTTTTTTSQPLTTGNNVQDMSKPEFPLGKAPRRPIPTNTINIISAKLRLYKIGRGPNAEPARFELPKISEFCNNTNDEIAAHQQQQRHQAHYPTSSIVSENLASVEEKIFVKIYWYTAPVTKNHYKKKLLYSRTLLVKTSGWIDFDIQKAAKTWLESKINYGLTVEVENEDNDLVDVGTYFSNTNCPLMNLTSARVPAPRGSSSGSRANRISEPVQSYPAPILELCTLTLPADPARGAVSYKISSFSPEGRLDPSVPVTSDLDQESSSHESEFWQSDDDEVKSLQTLSPTTTFPPVPHRRRHHHGSPQRSSLAARNTHRRDFGSSMQRDSPISDPQMTTTESTTTEFALDADHPLKKIFATAKSYLSRDEMNNRRRKHHRHHHRPAEGHQAAQEEEFGQFQPIILEAENIVIENNRQRR